MPPPRTLTIYQAAINIKCHFLDPELRLSLKRSQTQRNLVFSRTSEAVDDLREEHPELTFGKMQRCWCPYVTDPCSKCDFIDGLWVKGNSVYKNPVIHRYQMDGAQ